MKRYVLTAELDGSMTSIPITARNESMARVIGYIEIGKHYVSDKRWERGNITLTGQYDKEKKLIEIEKEGD